MPRDRRCRRPLLCLLLIVMIIVLAECRRYKSDSSRRNYRRRRIDNHTSVGTHTSSVTIGDHDIDKWALVGILCGSVGGTLLFCVIIWLTKYYMKHKQCPCGPCPCRVSSDKTPEEPNLLSYRTSPPEQQQKAPPRNYGSGIPPEEFMPPRITTTKNDNWDSQLQLPYADQ